MAYETKVILALLADRIANADSVKEAYEVIVKAAGVEGLELPQFEDAGKRKKEEPNGV